MVDFSKHLKQKKGLHPMGYSDDAAEAVTTELPNEINYNINTTNAEPDPDAPDLASSMNLGVDADRPRPPLPDSWGGKKIRYLALPDFSDADADKQFTDYDSPKVGPWWMGNIKLKIVNVSTGKDRLPVEGLPEDLWDKKVLGFQSIRSMFSREGTCDALDFLKSAGMLDELNALNGRVNDLPKSQVKRRNQELQDGLKELVRQAIIEGRHVEFSGYWEAQYNTGVKNEKGKDVWEPLPGKQGMKNFPPSDVWPCGHEPQVEAPNGEEVTARFKIGTWFPNRGEW